MSIPTGGIINTAYYDSVVQRIESCGTCDDIQKALNDATAGVTDQLANITARLAVLQPYIALATAPGANPAQIVTWITDFIAAQITPMVNASITLPLQMAQLATLPPRFIAAADAAKDRIGSCSITAPAFVPPVLDTGRLAAEGL